MKSKAVTYEWRMIPKKSGCLLRAEATVTDRYAVISTEKATYPVARMCEWLDVSRAGYYQWVTRPASATARRRATLATLIEGIFDASGGTYEARRVTADLRTSGKAAGVKQVGSIMRERGLVACQPRPYKRTTYGDRAVPGTGSGGPRLHRGASLGTSSWATSPMSAPGRAGCTWRL